MTDLIIFLVLMALGYGFGQLFEHRHYKSIRKREAALKDILIIQTKIPPAPLSTNHEQFITSGNVVISVDYFSG